MAPTKRPLDSPQRSVSKRPKRGKQRVFTPHQRTEPLPLSAVDGWGEEETLQLQFPVDSSLASSLTALCTAKSSAIALQLQQINLTLEENDRVQVQGLQDAQLSLTELFPNTYETWRPHIATLAEQKLLNLHINAKRETGESDWGFSFSVTVAWRKYMEICSSRGLVPVLASPRATPMRAMHHVMIWLLKRTHDAQRELSEEEMTCRYRYWDEVEVLYDRFVGDNKAVCAQFEGQTFAMPEIYARIDAAQQLSRDIGAFEDVERNSSDLLPTLRAFQKAAVSWMLSREKPSTQQSSILPVCVTFSKVATRQLQAYDPFCAAFHPESSAIPLQQEQLRPESLDVSSVRGGILADEMGLGKTVEVIALVLSHRRPSLRPQLLSAHSPSLDHVDGEEDDDIMACICGSSDIHPLGVVKCEFCGTWHHQLCTGFRIDESDSDTELSPTPGSRGLWDFGSASSNAWSDGRFMCYHCQSSERPSIASRTTLIVSPEPIHAQWENELSRHVRGGALSVMRYPGVRAVKSRLEEAGPSAEWQVLASPGLVLARYDVVLTTYEALAADLRHVPTSEGGDRRSSTRSQRKRYAFVSSPLVALNFWRVCMDEAQVGVENTRLQAALTLSRLSASNRWVVTGTPFSSRVSELFGYLRFLRIPPYTSAGVEGIPEENLKLLQAEHNEQESLDLGFFRGSIERNFVRGAVDRVLDLLLWDGQDAGGAVHGGGILWRTGKRHVLDQLGLPLQKSEVIRCQFTAVERHFYDRQEKRIVSLVQQRRGQSSQTGDVIERDDRLWQDLLILRQLCCHPQVGSARLAWGSGGNSTAGTVMTMDAFLQELVNKATRECEEAQRQVVGAQNGLAALLVLDNDIAGAALKYMAEVSLIRTNWPHFRADLLPRLHVLQNLERCIKELYSLPESNENGASSSTEDMAALDPKEVSLLPKLPALEKRISSAGLLPESGDLGSEDRTAIFHGCALLGQSAQQIRQYYLLQVDTMHAQALSNFRNFAEQIAASREQSSNAPSEMLCASGFWWNDALAIIEQSERNNNEQQLVSRVQARLSGFGTRWGTTFCSQLVSSPSLRLLLVRELEALSKRRRGLFERLGALSDGAPTDANIEMSGNCAKCREGGTGPTCVHCQLYKELEAYRKHFLGIDKTFVGKGRIMDLIDDEDQDDDATDAATTTGSGGLSVSLFIEVFKEIAGCARSALRSQQGGRVLATEIQDSMQTETDFWSKLQREWNAAKKLFQTQHQRLGALDELVMACSQLRLRQPGEPVGRTKAERLYKLERAEVPVRAAELEVERIAADFDLRDKMAQMRYLLELRSEEHTRREQQSQQIRTNSDASTEPQATQSICAVCLQEFTQTRAILPCAHVFCTGCITNVAGGRRNTRKSVRCPTCRRVCPVENIATVVEESASDLNNPENQIQTGISSEIPRQPSSPNRFGSLGSKLDALLGRVDMLRQENPGVKCLLFSQWSKMLKLAVQALPRLGVRCFMYGTKRQLPKLLSQFQACPAACVLALPFKVGANGLNIVEATEVILVEPLLSTSIEAQAVNRVHRLGQTRRTRVHRFIVQGSIEERIYRLSHKHKANTEQTENEDTNYDADSDDDEGLHRLGVAPGRKEQEKLTMQDLQELLRGTTDNTAASGYQQANAGTVPLFWEEMVVLNERSVSRQTAFEFLERRHAAVAREESQNLPNVVGEPQTELFDKPVALLVAEELFQLPYPSDAISGEVVERVDPQLLRRHLERVKEEIRVWKTASQ